MKDWFLSFITDMDPNANTYFNITDKPHWPVYNSCLGANGSVTPEFAVMDVNHTQIGVIPDLDVSAQCDFSSIRVRMMCGIRWRARVGIRCWDRVILSVFCEWY
jgi:hypothetical protein